MSADAVAAAQARLLADRSVQFSFAEHARPSPPPSWLISLLKSLSQAWPILRWVFLAALCAVIVYALWIAGREAWRRFRAAGQGRRPKLDLPASVAGSLQPAPGRARALLEEADRLAAQGLFEEAAHVLLFRTIDDLESRRPRAVRPALTSRDLAALEVLPAPARSAFAIIVEAVERSFFAGRHIGAADFAICRQAYQTFAAPQSWAAA